MVTRLTGFGLGPPAPGIPPRQLHSIRPRTSWPPLSDEATRRPASFNLNPDLPTRALAGLSFRDLPCSLSIWIKQEGCNTRMCGCGMHGDSGGERHRTLRHERGGCGGKRGHAWYESSATEPVEQAPAAPRARKAQPSATRQGRLAREPPPHHLRDSCMRPPPARSEDGACGEAAMSAGLVTSDSNRGGKVWWPDIANTAPAGWLGPGRNVPCTCDVAVGMRRSRSGKPARRCTRWG